MLFRQGRVKAENPDQAAMKIRKKYNEYSGSLTVKWTPLKNTYEYLIEITKKGG